MVLALLAAVAFAIGCDIYDVVLTEKGIKAGVAVEGNTFLVGSKPSALALYLRDSLAIGAATVPAVLALVGHNDPLFLGLHCRANRCGYSTHWWWASVEVPAKWRKT